MPGRARRHPSGIVTEQLRQGRRAVLQRRGELRRGRSRLRGTALGVHPPGGEAAARGRSSAPHRVRVDPGLVARRARPVRRGDQGAAARPRTRAPLHDGAARHAARRARRPARPARRRRRGRSRRGRDRGGEPEHLGQRRARDVGDAHRAHSGWCSSRRTVVAGATERAPRRGCRRALRSGRPRPRRVRVAGAVARGGVRAHDAAAVARALEAGGGRGGGRSS